MNKIITLKLFFILTFIITSVNVFGQLTYIGLKDKANIRKAQNELVTAATYWPKTQIIDHYLYIPTQTGIYRKNLANTLNDTLWQLYAFPNIPIRSFVKKNDSILATTSYYETSNLLLKSTDNGATYTDITSSHFFVNTPESTVVQIAMNPNNKNEIFTLNYGPGVSKSSNFGSTWNAVNNFIGGYQDWFIGFNPNDTNNIFYTGEGINFQSHIMASYNNGNTWQKVDSLQTHCTHGVAFHPFDKNIMISYGEGRIQKSINQGKNWITKGSTSLYVFKVIYDPNNPDILYATGDTHGSDYNIHIYKSEDGGETWFLAHLEYIPDSDGALDMHLYNNKLVLLTLKNGIYSIDTTLLSSDKFNIDEPILIFPNPAKDVLHINYTDLIKHVSIFNTNGRLVYSNNINNRETSINIAHLSKGIYFVQITTDKGIGNKKIIKK